MSEDGVGQPLAAKKTKIENRDQSHKSDTSGMDRGHNSAVEALSVDELAITFGYLSLWDILRARVTCAKWKSAAAVAHVPISFGAREVRRAEPRINSSQRFGMLAWMARDLRNLQQISVEGNGIQFKCGGSGGDAEHAEDAEPSGEPRDGPPRVLCDIDVVSRFPRLNNLLLRNVHLNGRYPSLFGFAHLRELVLHRMGSLKFDLGALSNSPLLEVLCLTHVERLQGNLKSLRSLRDTLREARIIFCPGVTGDFMELADFPLLDVYDLNMTHAKGDMRGIGDKDFPKVKELRLPAGVYGSGVFDSVADAPALMTVICRFLRRGVLVHGPGFANSAGWHGDLSPNSPDFYEMDVFTMIYPPFHVHAFRAGERVGWRWTNGRVGGSCEMNWDDPPPDEEGDDYNSYLEKLKQIEGGVGVFKGFRKPPTLDEYNGLGQPHI